MFKKICALLTKKPKNSDFPVKMDLANILEKLEKKQTVPKATTKTVKKTIAKVEKSVAKKVADKKPAAKKTLKKK